MTTPELRTKLAPVSHIRRFARSFGRILRAVGREIAATIRVGGPAMAATPDSHLGGSSADAQLGIVAGLTKLSQKDEGERPSSG